MKTTEMKMENNELIKYLWDCGKIARPKLPQIS